MRPSRTLALKRETLSPLTPDELGGIAGASHLCGTEPVTHASVDQSCPTFPVVPCLSLDCVVVNTLNCIAIRTFDCPTV